MIGRQGYPVHLVTEQVLGVHGVLEGHASGEVLGDGQRPVRELSGITATRDTGVVADRHRPLVVSPEDHLDPQVQGSRPLEDLAQRRAGPARVPDEPDGECGDTVGVAGALEGEGHLSAGEALEVGQRQALRVCDQSGHVQAPRRRRELWLVVVLDGEELVVGGEVLDVLPHQRMGQDVPELGRYRRGLVEPRDDHPTVGMPGKGSRRTGHRHDGQPGQGSGGSTFEKRAAGDVCLLLWHGSTGRRRRSW